MFSTFLKLGLTSFGGPIAHLGYFRREFVERRAWLTEPQFAQLLAICQFLPGPASSQLGFAVGLLRAGWLGALSAFIAFTLPSASLLLAFAVASMGMIDDTDSGLLHGLKLVALPVVAHGVISMARSLCPDSPRATLAIVAAIVMLLIDSAWAQLAIILLGAVTGLFLLQNMPAPPEGNLSPGYGMKTAWTLLGMFLLLLVVLPLLSAMSGGVFDIAAPFYQAGALVFGGGHVVLPLLEEAVVTPGMVSADDFLAGYGAAQAVPGPMFSFAAYLGAQMLSPEGAIIGAVTALIAIFLPGLLLVAGVLPLWGRVAGNGRAASAIAGVNATVVGLLAAALYDPIWTSTVSGWSDLFVALVGLLLLMSRRVQPLYVVLWCVGASVMLSYTGRAG